VPVPRAGYGDRFTIQSRRPSGHVTEHLDRSLHVSIAGIGYRLAVVERLQLGEFVAMLLKKVGQAPDNSRSLSRLERCPWAGFKSSSRSADRQVDIIFVARWDASDGLLRCRILNGEALAAFRGHPFPVNEELSLFA
jgi:hypothetical protein